MTTLSGMRSAHAVPLAPTIATAGPGSVAFERLLLSADLATDEDAAALVRNALIDRAREPGLDLVAARAGTPLVSLRPSFP